MACTTHRVQGLTLSKVVFSFELFRQKSFIYGQVYVALSRVRSLDQLFIIGDIERKHIHCDPRVHSEYERLRAAEMQRSKGDVVINTNNRNIIITLLNIRSLKKFC